MTAQFTQIREDNRSANSFKYLDYSTEFLFGESANTLAGDLSKLNANTFIAAFDRSLLQVARSAIPWPLRFLYGYTKDWNKPFEESQTFVDKYVAEAVQRKDDFSESEGEDEAELVFLRELVRQTKSRDKSFLRNQMLNIFFPARDASGIGISLILFHVSRDLRVWRKIKDEVFSIPRDLTYEDVKNLKYVNAVINESKFGLALCVTLEQKRLTSLKLCECMGLVGMSIETA